MVTRCAGLWLERREFFPSGMPSLLCLKITRGAARAQHCHSLAALSGDTEKPGEEHRTRQQFFAELSVYRGGSGLVSTPELRSKGSPQAHQAHVCINEYRRTVLYSLHSTLNHKEGYETHWFTTRN